MNDPLDTRLVRRAPNEEPYMAIVHGRHVYRRMNETLPQFVARIGHMAAKMRESPWYRLGNE